MSSSLVHSRNASEESNVTMLEHLLQFPGNYEVPLRTMYTINCAARARPTGRSRAPTPTSGASPSSPTSGRAPWTDGDNSSHDFTAALMNQISQLPSQPCSLPPTFIVSFVSKCFPPNLDKVDFLQSLAALDYIRDLETRRRKEFTAALRRLNVLPNTVGTEADDFSDRYPGTAAWVTKAEALNKKADAYYCQTWVTLRRWVMINEMSVEPFNRFNCQAMLNTLYPPPHPGRPQPIKDLSPEKYNAQREGFFNYITAVGKRGVLVLNNLKEQGALQGDETGWPATQISLDKFLATAKKIIDDCMEATSVEHFDPPAPVVQETPSRKGKKTDSGVSFGSNRPPSTSNGKDQPLSTSPAITQTSSHKSLGGWGKLQRELKRLRVKTRPEVEEIAKPEKAEKLSPVVDITDNDNKQVRPKIKKMKSMGSLQSLRTGNLSSVSLAGRRKASDTDNFNAEEMKRQRIQYEKNPDMAKSKDEKYSTVNGRGKPRKI